MYLDSKAWKSGTTFFPPDDFQLPPALEKFSVDIALYDTHTNEAASIHLPRLHTFHAKSPKPERSYKALQPQTLLMLIIPNPTMNPNTSRSKGSSRNGPLRLYLAAPNVWGLEVMSEDLGAFLEPEDGVYLIDRWEHLERLVIIGGVQKLEDMRRWLVPWLKE
ncbi:hypothetical protein SCLCIDRAFT_28456 [Scleroderma citrinum Foug A]|uniref:Uncharacterized protein n=1 Tax=Scleroderma citrinum Foug A TaxID=1036808 RepID=A0A0C2Z7G8_9AGAM|nr:hypothetical protein SCLCIDRAFT_28456 [Scleroderma citrinum Foug A]